MNTEKGTPVSLIKHILSQTVEFYYEFLENVQQVIKEVVKGDIQSHNFCFQNNLIEQKERVKALNGEIQKLKTKKEAKYFTIAFLQLFALELTPSSYLDVGLLLSKGDDSILRSYLRFHFPYLMLFDYYADDCLQGDIDPMYYTDSSVAVDFLLSDSMQIGTDSLIYFLHSNYTTLCVGATNNIKQDVKRLKNHPEVKRIEELGFPLHISWLSGYEGLWEREMNFWIETLKPPLNSQKSILSLVA